VGAKSRSKSAALSPVLLSIPGKLKIPQTDINQKKKKENKQNYKQQHIV
jgi:hypothetical protein